MANRLQGAAPTLPRQREQVGGGVVCWSVEHLAAALRSFPPICDQHGTSDNEPIRTTGQIESDAKGAGLVGRPLFSRVSLRQERRQIEEGFHSRRYRAQLKLRRFGRALGLLDCAAIRYPWRNQ